MSQQISEFVIILRAVATTVRATEMLYIAADLLTPGETESDRRVNATVAMMTARLLDLSEADPEMTERVLRSLPER